MDKTQLKELLEKVSEETKYIHILGCYDERLESIKFTKKKTNELYEKLLNGSDTDFEYKGYVISVIFMNFENNVEVDFEVRTLREYEREFS